VNTAVRGGGVLLAEALLHRLTGDAKDLAKFCPCVTGDAGQVHRFIKLLIRSPGRFISRTNIRKDAGSGHVSMIH